ncbi:MAG: rhodanese-like domain-containing protein, partial [Campylobacterota bacterium]
NGKEYTIKRQSIAPCKEYKTAPDDVWKLGNVSAACKTTLATHAGRLQPIAIEGVQTYGELEVLEFLKKAQVDSQMMLIDARGEHWMPGGTIPGAVNITHDALEYLDLLHDSYVQTMQRLGVQTDANEYDFSNAKELVVFCNGKWCPQSHWFIKNLIKIGYPKDKLKWYRGGVASWKSVGLTIAK